MNKSFGLFELLCIFSFLFLKYNPGISSFRDKCYGNIRCFYKIIIYSTGLV